MYSISHRSFFPITTLDEERHFLSPGRRIIIRTILVLVVREYSRSNSIAKDATRTGFRYLCTAKSEIHLLSVNRIFIISNLLWFGCLSYIKLSTSFIPCSSIAPFFTDNISMKLIKKIVFLLSCIACASGHYPLREGRGLQEGCSDPSNDDPEGSNATASPTQAPSVSCPPSVAPSEAPTSLLAPSEAPTKLVDPSEAPTLLVDPSEAPTSLEQALTKAALSAATSLEKIELLFTIFGVFVALLGCLATFYFAWKNAGHTSRYEEQVDIQNHIAAVQTAAALTPNDTIIDEDNLELLVASASAFMTADYSEDDSAQLIQLIGPGVANGIRVC